MPDVTSLAGDTEFVSFAACGRRSAASGGPTALAAAAASVGSSPSPSSSLSETSDGSGVWQSTAVGESSVGRAVAAATSEAPAWEEMETV